LPYFVRSAGIDHLMHALQHIWKFSPIFLSSSPETEAVSFWRPLALQKTFLYRFHFKLLFTVTKIRDFGGPEAFADYSILRHFKCSDQFVITMAAFKFVLAL
jgi:hypothetical protein